MGVSGGEQRACRVEDGTRTEREPTFGRGGGRRGFFFLIWNGPSEGSDLIIFGLGERASGGERRTQMESGGGEHAKERRRPAFYQHNC